ncbi:MAG: ATP-binding protein [Bacteroidales bacterium]|nr:ATP-binding protein [Bacteroidales bacterium]
MLIDFAVTNFRSIKERQEFSMQTVARIDELIENTIETDDEELVRSAIIYGRNASGKSNLLLAMDTLQNLTTDAAFFTKEAYKPYKLDTESTLTSTTFEINFIVFKIKYNYSIEFDEKLVVKEILYFFPNGKKTLLFNRKFDDIKTGPSFRGSVELLKNGLYPNQSIISKVSTQKIDSLIPIYQFFNRHFITQTFFGNDINLHSHLENNFDNPNLPNQLLNLSKLLSVADTGISNIKVKSNIEEDLPVQMSKNLKKKIIEENPIEIFTTHNICEGNNIVRTIDFSLEEESEGTKKLLSFGSVMLDCLNDGDVMIVDELDKSLHPKLTKALIQIFNNPKSNPNNAQLIFASHDVSLLSNQLFRRDQIWFAEKNIGGASQFHSLADIKGVRSTISYEKYYMNDAFGGTPVINQYDLEFNFDKNEQAKSQS